MKTKIKITGSVVLTEELDSYIHKKIEKLALLIKNDSTTLCDVEVGTTTAGKRSGDVYRAEIHLTYTGGDVYVEAITDTLHGAIDEATDEARQKLAKDKDKERDMMRRTASELKSFFRNFGK